MIDDERLDRLLLKLLSGEATPADQQELDRAIAERPALRGEIERLRAAWRALGDRREGTDRAWVRFNRRIRGEVVVRSVVMPVARARPGWLIPFATGVLAAGILWMIWPSPRPAPITYATAQGERASIGLGDGSHIMLGPSSRLRLADGGRTVDLDGEAAFDVIHDPAHPFAVRAGRVVVRDIGTQFVVRAYGSDTTVRVAVAAGRVTLDAGVPGVAEYALGPGDGASVRGDGATRLAHGVQPVGGGPWDRRLHFKETPLPDVAKAFSWWFGVEVMLGDSTLSDRAITGSVGLDEPDSEALRSIALVARARAIRRGHGFVLMPNPQ